jgi:hypothetical protein
MKIRYVTGVFLVLCSVMLMPGFAWNKTGFEGRLVDGRGNPMSGIKIVAKQVQPVNGYEHFETASGPDGTFRFRGVLPFSDYVIAPRSDSWITSSSIKTRSGPEGKMNRLDEPLMVRFILSRDGVIKDSKTGLEWAPASDREMPWNLASDYAGRLRLAGGGWRLPTRVELKNICDTSGEVCSDPLFNINGSWVWTGESTSAAVWGFDFEDGEEDKSRLGNDRDLLRVVAVRSGKV